MPENLTILEQSPPNLNATLPLEEVLVVLEAYHQRQQEKLQEIRSGFSELNLECLKQMAQALQTRNTSRGEFLTLLTQHLMAILDGGDGPIWLQDSSNASER